MELAIFFGISALVVVVGAGTTTAVVLLKRKRLNAAFPVRLKYGVRASHSQFSTADLNQLLMFLMEEYPEKELGACDLKGFHLNFRPDLDPLKEEGDYDVVLMTADIPCKGVKDVWEVSVAHESTHYAVDRYRKMVPHPFYDLLWSEKTGCVRRARVRAGMYPYPEMEWPDD